MEMRRLRGQRLAYDRLVHLWQRQDPNQGLPESDMEALQHITSLYTDIYINAKQSMKVRVTFKVMIQVHSQLSQSASVGAIQPQK